MKVSLSTRPRKRCLRMRGEINLEVGTGSIVLGESRWLVIIYSHPVRNVLLFEIQSRKVTNNNLEYLQRKRNQKAVVFFSTSCLYLWITFWRTCCCLCSFIENVLVAFISFNLSMSRGEFYVRKRNIQKRFVHLFIFITFCCCKTTVE